MRYQALFLLFLIGVLGGCSFQGGPLKMTREITVSEPVVVGKNCEVGYTCVQQVSGFTDGNGTATELFYECAPYEELHICTAIYGTSGTTLARQVLPNFIMAGGEIIATNLKTRAAEDIANIKANALRDTAAITAESSGATTPVTVVVDPDTHIEVIDVEQNFDPTQHLRR